MQKMKGNWKILQLSQEFMKQKDKHSVGRYNMGGIE
jgi:hypothetical protein